MKVFNPRLITLSKKIRNLINFLPYSIFSSEKNIPPRNPSSILILDFHLIGDIVLLTPVLNELRKNNPNAHIGLASGVWAKHVLKNHPDLYDSFYPISAPWVTYSYNLKSWYLLLCALIDIRKSKWELGIEIRGDVRQILMLRMCNAKHRVGYDFTGGSRLLTSVVKDDGNIKHILEHHFQIVKHLYIETKFRNFKPELWISDDEIKSSCHKPRGVVLHFGGSMPLKIFSNRIALKVLKKVLQNYPENIILFNTIDQSEIIKYILNNISEYDLKRIEVKSIPLREFIVEVSKSTTFIGMDSAGGHIASALSVPTRVIYGPTSPDYCKPIGLDVKVIYLDDERVPCRPCDQNKCIHNEYQYCLEMIDVNEIIKK